MNVCHLNHLSCSDAGSNDFYGPLCIVACYISLDDYKWLLEYNIEKVDCSDIYQIIKYGKILKDKLIYSLLILDNTHYNSMIDQGYKMAQMKTRLYNQAMINVIKRVKEPINIKVISPFLTSKKYYKNLKNKTLVVSHLLFDDNEKKYIGLKCAKILSQYAYYQYFRNMEQSLKITLPHGCNKDAINTGIQLIQTYDIDILNKVSKKNLPNYKQIIERIKASD